MCGVWGWRDMFIKWTQDRWLGDEEEGVCRGLCLLWFARQGQIVQSGFQIRAEQIVLMAQQIHRRRDTSGIEYQRLGLRMLDWGELRRLTPELVYSEVNYAMKVCSSGDLCYLFLFDLNLDEKEPGHVIGQYGCTKGFDPNMGFWIFDGGTSQKDWTRQMLTKYAAEEYRRYSIRTLWLERKGGWATSYLGTPYEGISKLARGIFSV